MLLLEQRLALVNVFFFPSSSQVQVESYCEVCHWYIGFSGKIPKVWIVP